MLKDWWPPAVRILKLARLWFKAVVAMEDMS